MMNFTIASMHSRSSSRSANAISGSIIQNSAAWRWVLEFSARNVGPKVYTSPKASAKFSALSWPDTVRFVLLPKKSLEKSTLPSAVRGRLSRSSVVTRNISPAPSQSEPVMIGVWT